MSCNNACGANYYQGDQYSFIFKIEQCEAPLDLEGVVLIEFTVGTLSKQWPTVVTYDEEQKVVLFPVTQEETFAMEDYEQYQVRIKYASGNIYASPINKIYIKGSLSKKII